MVDGLGVAGRIWLHAGAERVMPATFSWQEYRTPASLDGLASTIRETGDLLMTSAHPQGGNAIGDVVDEDFRVRGFANLFLCDASVFPTSLHVNPQLTVMGMAQYAARPHPAAAGRRARPGRRLAPRSAAGFAPWAKTRKGTWPPGPAFPAPPAQHAVGDEVAVLAPTR